MLIGHSPRGLRPILFSGHLILPAGGFLATRWPAKLTQLFAATKILLG
jgi:hypothetical protein